MKRLTLILAFVVSGIALVASYGLVLAATPTTDNCDRTRDAYCFAPAMTTLSSRIDTATLPKIATPSWMSAPSEPAARTVTYVVSSKGTVKADFNDY